MIPPCVSLAGQPLLTQKAIKGLVNGVAPACLNGMYITSSNVMSLTINYAYWVRDCAIAQYASEYRAAVTNASLRLGYRRYWFQMTNMATNRQLLRRFSCRQLSMSLPYLVRDIISTLFSARARYKLSCDLILQFHW